jgi:hypothetical protein
MCLKREYQSSLEQIENVYPKLYSKVLSLKSYVSKKELSRDEYQQLHDILANQIPGYWNPSWNFVTENLLYISSYLENIFIEESCHKFRGRKFTLFKRINNANLETVLNLCTRMTTQNQNGINPVEERRDALQMSSERYEGESNDLRLAEIFLDFCTTIGQLSKIIKKYEIGILIEGSMFKDIIGLINTIPSPNLSKIVLKISHDLEILAEKQFRKRSNFKIASSFGIPRKEFLPLLALIHRFEITNPMTL